MSTFPSLNIEKLRNDTIKKLEKEKQDKINREKQQQKQYDYQNYLNLSHIKNSNLNIYSLNFKTKFLSPYASFILGIDGQNL